VINHRVFQVTEHHHGRDAKFRQPGEGVTGHELTGIGTPRGAELPGPVADQEPETGGALTELHQEVPDRDCNFNGVTPDNKGDTSD
jgi:hypothetical protein